jgi:hypothetical protein
LQVLLERRQRVPGEGPHVGVIESDRELVMGCKLESRLRPH